MTSGRPTSHEQNDQSFAAPIPVPTAVQIAWAASFLLWRVYYLLTVVIIPAMGWR